MRNRYLLTLLLSLLLSCILISSIKPLEIKAETKSITSYYEEVINEWGFNPFKDEENENTQEKPEDEITPDIDEEDSYESKSDNDLELEKEAEKIQTIILELDKNRTDLDQTDNVDTNKNSIEIETSENILFIISFDDSYLIPDGFDKIPIEIDTKDYIYIWKGIKDNQTQFIIQERDLYTPTNRDLLKDYFSSYKKSLENEKNILTQGSAGTDQTPQNKNNIVRNLTTEMLSYLIIISLLILSFIIGAKFVRTYKSTLRTIKTEKGNNNEPIYSVLKATRPIILILIILLLFAFMFILFVITIKDTGNINIPYMFDYIVQLFNKDHIKQFTQESAIVPLFLIFLLTMIAIFIGIFIITIVLLNTQDLVNFKYNGNLLNKISDDLKPHLILGVLVTIVLVTTWLGVEAAYILIASLLILAIIFIFYTPKSVITISWQKKYRLIYSLLFIGALLVGLVLNQIYVTSKPNKIIIENILTEDRIITPTRIDLNPKTTQIKIDDQNKTIYDNTSEVYVNNYLIYHPNYNNIENRNISDLDPTNGNSIVLIDTNNVEYLELFSEYQNLIKYYVSSEGTKWMYLSNLDRYEKSDLRFKLQIDCSEPDITPDNIDITYYSIDNSNTENTLHSKVVYFPGCKDSPINSFEVPIPKYLLDDNYILEISGINGKYIEGAVITTNTDKVISENLKLDTIKYIINDQTSENIKIYNIDTDKTIKFENTDTPTFQEIIERNINTLLNQNLISKTLFIWTPEVGFTLKQPEYYEVQ